MAGESYGGNECIRLSKEATLKIEDTILAVLSDMHTGSSTALFPARGFKAKGMDGNHVSPNDKQREIYPVFIRFAGEVAKARKGKRLIIVHNGDAIDGFHHGSLQESLFNTQDQSDAHKLLMGEFIRRVGRNKGDELYYVRGTEVHVGQNENEIAKELGAVKASEDTHVHGILELNINGMIHCFAHHGKARGAGQNEGNSLRNFLRDIRSDREKDGLPRIDVLWSGHTHGHTYNTHIARQRNDFHVMHGVICPSFQAKTTYALGKVPMAVNSVGGVYARITADGMMDKPRFVVQTTADK